MATLAAACPRRLHHLTVVVPNLDAAVDHWRAVLGAEPIAESLPGRGVRTVRFDLSGVWLVLVEPVDATGVPAMHLAGHGPGVFLLSFAVEDLDDALAELALRGIQSTGAVRGGLAQWKVQDITPDPASGLRLQLCVDPAQDGSCSTR